MITLLSSFARLQPKDRRARGRAASTTVLCEVSDQFIHSVEIDAVDQAAALAPLHDQARAMEVLQVERE
jgi:hypothetical protein